MVPGESVHLAGQHRVEDTLWRGRVGEKRENNRKTVRVKGGKVMSGALELGRKEEKVTTKQSDA